MLDDFLIILALVIANGLFAGAEIAVLTIRRSRLAELMDRGSRGARAVQALRDHPERFLATVQVGITVIGVASAAYGGEFIAGRLAGTLRRHGLGSWSEELAFVLVVGFVSYFALVVGELVPKSLALRHADRYSVLVGRPLLFVAAVMRPLVWFLTASSNLVLRLFGDRTTFTETRLSREELQELVAEAAKTGSIDAPSGEIASRAIGFGEVTVGELMVPRHEIVALPRRAAADEVQRVLLEQGHSRMPVYDPGPERIIGYVIAKDILALAWQPGLVILDDITRPVTFVPETARAADVLRTLQRGHTQLAIVLDERGELAGLVTAEDLVEELVGEIFSEQEAEPITRAADGTALVRGTVAIRELNRELGVELPESDEFATVAGLVISLGGWIPKPGTKFRAADGTELEVVEATSRRVTVVRVIPPRPSADSDSGTE